MNVSERLRQGVTLIAQSAWDAAGQHVVFARQFTRNESRSLGEAQGMLAALFFLDATPEGEQLDLNSLIGARAWVMGEGEMIPTMAHRLPGAMFGPRVVISGTRKSAEHGGCRR